MKVRFPQAIGSSLAIWKISCVAMALAASAVLPAPAHGEDDSMSRPNIVLIYADDLDADEIGCTADAVDTWATPSGAKRTLGEGAKAGIPKMYTPHIDSLAKEGMLFTRFYVNATVCTSSRYCLLTGRYASRGRENLKRAAVKSEQQG